MPAELPPRRPYGPRNGRAKLDYRKVRAIRWLSFDGWSQGELGKLFGVSKSAITQVLDRRSWWYV